MANLPIAVAKAGAGFVAGSIVARVFKPLGDTLGTVGKMFEESNEHTRRTIETRSVTRKTNDVIQRMDLETLQRKALISYGNETSDLNRKFDEMDAKARKAIEEWQVQFPDIL